MEEERGYKRLKVWIAARELVAMVYGKLKGFPAEERFALCDQIRRAVVSVPSNIAEGYGRDTHKDFAHFLSQAKGSLYELDTQLDLAIDLGYMKRDAALDSKIDEISRMLSAFRTRLLTSPTPSPHGQVLSAECRVRSQLGQTPHSAPSTPHSTQHSAPSTPHSTPHSTQHSAPSTPH